MAKFSREKGKRGERELADLLKPFFPDARRGASQNRSGSDCPDVVAGSFWWECKRGTRTSPKAALKQAKDATDGRIPVAYTRDDRDKGVISMYSEDFLRLFGWILPGVKHDDNS